MDEEKLNISIRKFLKNVGITSQRNIENRIRDKMKSGEIKAPLKIKVIANISSDQINLDQKIEGEIEI
tara:strand:+ start:14 stop:217 length:204 start_codon:yes stop_codon:yes gene_type:complete